MSPRPPDQPLRADATDEQIRQRHKALFGPGSTTEGRIAQVAREYAAACVAEILAKYTAAMDEVDRLEAQVAAAAPVGTPAPDPVAWLQCPVCGPMTKRDRSVFDCQRCDNAGVITAPAPWPLLTRAQVIAAWDATSNNGDTFAVLLPSWDSRVMAFADALEALLRPAARVDAPVTSPSSIGELKRLAELILAGTEDVSSQQAFLCAAEILAEGFRVSAPADAPQSNVARAWRCTCGEIITQGVTGHDECGGPIDLNPLTKEERQKLKAVYLKDAVRLEPADAGDPRVREAHQRARMLTEAFEFADPEVKPTFDEVLASIDALAVAARGESCPQEKTP